MLSVTLLPAILLVAVADTVHPSAEYAARTERIRQDCVCIARCAIKGQAAAVRCAKRNISADIAPIGGRTVLEGQQSVVKGERLPACNVEVRAAEETDRATAAATAIRVENYPVQRVRVGESGRARHVQRSVCHSRPVEAQSRIRCTGCPCARRYSGR